MLPWRTVEGKSQPQIVRSKSYRFLEEVERDIWEATDSAWNCRLCRWEWEVPIVWHD